MARAARREGQIESHRWDEFASDAPIDTQRYLDALRRGRWLVAGVVVPAVVVAVAVSLASTKSYRASATIVLDPAVSSFGSSDVEAVKRQLATVQTLLTTRGVLQGAAKKLRVESPQTLKAKVTSSVDSQANIIRITANDADPTHAAAIANAVAREFLRSQQSVERLRLARARSNLLSALDRERASGGSVAVVNAIRGRLSEIAVQEASAGTELRLAEVAQPPREPSSPRPLLSGLLALFATLFLGVLLVLARDQLRPRVSNPRELAQTLDLPMLAQIPRMGKRALSSGGLAEAESYNTLWASLRMLPPSSQQALLVTSAVRGEGKTRVAVGLANAIAQSGFATLLVSADLRRPSAHKIFGVNMDPGLVDIVQPANNEATDIKSVIHEVRADGRFLSLRPTESDDPRLSFLASGEAVANPAQVLSETALTTFLLEIRKLPYRYVIFDSTPLLGVADAHTLARLIDVIIVSRMDYLESSRAQDLRDLLNRLAITPLGMVAVEARDVPSYYSSIAE